MKKKTIRIMTGILALALAGALMLTGCGSSSGSSSGSASSGSGSSTEASGSVSTNGSTSMEKVIGNLSEQYMNDHSGVKITYDATGSGTGIEAAKKGTCDIGLASRDLTKEEKDGGLQQKTIALDGIAVIVNAKSPVKDLSVKQIADIYTGKITSWDKVGGSAQKIAPIGRESGSGTRDGFETITNTADKCRLSQELTSTGAVIEAVRNSQNAVGYASYSDAKGQKGIRILTVGGVKCTEGSIANGKYKIQRNFNLITKKGTKLSGQARKFYDYMTSKDASKLIQKAGVVPTAK